MSASTTNDPNQARAALVQRLRTWANEIQHMTGAYAGLDWLRHRAALLRAAADALAGLAPQPQAPPDTSTVQAGWTAAAKQAVNALAVRLTDLPPPLSIADQAEDGFAPLPDAVVLARLDQWIAELHRLSREAAQGQS